MSSATLLKFIHQRNIHAKLLTNIGHTPTVSAAAQALGVHPDQVIKTLLFEIEKPSVLERVVVIGYGEHKVDKKLLGEVVGVGKKHIAMAQASTVLMVLGYIAGGVPPFGHRTTLPVILDAGVLKYVVSNRSPAEVMVYGGGGDDYTMMELSVGELVRVTQPSIHVLSK